MTSTEPTSCPLETCALIGAHTHDENGWAVPEQPAAPAPTERPAHYFRSAGYSMIDHELDPVIDVAWTWLGEARGDDDRGMIAEALAETLEAAAEYLRRAGQRPEPLELECPTCYAPEGQSCCTTEEEAAAHVSWMSDAEVIDQWGGADELGSYCTVPTLTELRADLEDERTYQDRTPHPERIETAANVYRHELLGW